MDETNFTLTRRKLLAGAATVGVAGAGAGAGSAALFSDTETDSAGLTAGTLNLTLDGSDASVTFLSQTGIAPGDTGSGTVTLENTGSVDGYVDVAVSTTNFENGLASNENSVDGTGGDPGEGNGELQNYLETSGTLGGTSVWSNTTVANLQSGYDRDVPLAPGASADFVLDWTFQNVQNDPQRDAQTDSVSIQLTFRLDQEVDAGL